MDDLHSPVDADPDEPGPAAGGGALYVPVRLGSAGGRHLRFLRTPLGHRTAVGFSSAARLGDVLGAQQPWVRLGEPALRALAAPLGVTVLTVDPQLTAPAAQSGPQPATRPVPAPWFAVTGIRSYVD
ncbi:SAV_915 family protein [Streptomyces sp. NPDC048442]|uniref:SAV_915 family protein n=1 Tax=Streptomyces sp. NPDC048442 TaxID=3154823 RepID=UPI0034151572